MTTEAELGTTDNYYRMTQALAKVYEIAREGKLGRPENVRQLDNYLHSVATEFRARNHSVLQNHNPELVDILSIATDIAKEKERKEEEDKWEALKVTCVLLTKLMR
jgi:hypothetical protein